jgi:2-keto-3-deoxy-L-fuconate dehydrogenase
LVTAAGQGIGRATAEAFAKEGATVIATDLKPELLEGFPGRVEKLNALEQVDVLLIARGSCITARFEMRRMNSGILLLI